MYVLMSCCFFFLLFLFLSSVLIYGWSYSMSMLEVLVLHRVVKTPNSLRRDPNLSLEKKTLFFVFYLRCRGTNR